MPTLPLHGSEHAPSVQLVASQTACPPSRVEGLAKPLLPSCLTDERWFPPFTPTSHQMLGLGVEAHRNASGNA